MANNIWQWFQETSPNTGGVTDKIQAYLTGLGYIGATNESMYSWLGGLGYTGTLPERIEQFERVNTSRYGSLAATDPFWSNVVLYMPLNSDFKDYKNNFTFNASGNASNSSSVVKAGSGSLALDGNGDFLAYPYLGDSAKRNLFNLEGTAQWTVELWLYLTGTNAFGPLISTRSFLGVSPFTVQGWSIEARNQQLYAYINGSATNANSGVADIPLNQWVHICVERNGATMRSYVDGVKKGETLTQTNGNTQDLDKSIWIASTEDALATDLIAGYIDEVRITKGVCRYGCPATSFTLPSTPYPIS